MKHKKPNMQNSWHPSVSSNSTHDDSNDFLTPQWPKRNHSRLLLYCNTNPVDLIPTCASYVFSKTALNKPSRPPETKPHKSAAPDACHPLSYL